MPKRPLSAYNLFFAEERKRLLHEPNEEKSCSGSESSKMGFANLARTVAAKWKLITPQDKVKFQKAAEVERLRYKREMTDWENMLDSIKQAKDPELVGPSVLAAAPAPTEHGSIQGRSLTLLDQSLGSIESTHSASSQGASMAVRAPDFVVPSTRGFVVGQPSTHLTEHDPSVAVFFPSSSYYTGNLNPTSVVAFEDPVMAPAVATSSAGQVVSGDALMPMRVFPDMGGASSFTLDGGANNGQQHPTITSEALIAMLSQSLGEDELALLGRLQNSTSNQF